MRNGTHEEDLGLGGVGDPHLGPGNGVVAAVLALGRGRLERECVGAGRGLGEREGTELIYWRLH